MEKDKAGKRDGVLGVGVENCKLSDREGLPGKMSFLYIPEGSEGTGH